MKEDNRRQDDLIEQLNRRMMNCDVAEDDAVVTGESKIFNVSLVLLSPGTFTTNFENNVLDFGS